MPTEPPWTDVADLPKPLAAIADEEGHEYVLGAPGDGKRLWSVEVEVARTFTVELTIPVLAATEAEARETAMAATYTVDVETYEDLWMDTQEWQPQGVENVEALEADGDAQLRASADHWKAEARRLDVETINLSRCLDEARRQRDARETEVARLRWLLRRARVDVAARCRVPYAVSAWVDNPAAQALLTEIDAELAREVQHG